MRRKIAAAALILALVLSAGSHAMAHGKDAVLALAARAIVLTLDTSTPPRGHAPACAVRTASAPPPAECETRRLLTARG